MSGGHSGLWPHFRPDIHAYPWRWDRLDELRESIVLNTEGRAVCEKPSREELDELYTRLGVGTRPTFASLGRWSYWHQWELEYGDRQYSAPNSACIAALKAWTPPRTDVLAKELVGRGRVVDLPSAYPNRFRMHPCGTSARILSEPQEGECWTWFGLCRVYVPHELALGPFKVRRDGRGYPDTGRGDRTGRGQSSKSISRKRNDLHVCGTGTLPGSAEDQAANWPRQPGEYRAWLWREQADECRLAGCDVEVQHGWCWEWFTTDNAPWVDRLMEVRNTLPGGRNGTLGTLAKMATNAAIGYQGIGSRYQARVKAGTGEAPVVVARRLTNEDWSEERTGRATMIHWQRYTEMLVARDLYRLALPYAEQGKLYRLWFDEMEVAA